MASNDDSEVPTESEHARDQRRRGATVAAPDVRYRMLALLGQGGMGEVVAAHDNVLGREVAIKRMRESAPSALHISRFLREAQIQGRLDHPTVPPVHELAHDDRGLPYFVMKRLSGTTLAKIIDRIAAGDTDVRVRFPLRRLLGAFVDVCLAIELAHTRGVIHRDIKPSNIMLGEFGEVFMIDWGVAKIIGDFDPWTDGTREAIDEPDATVPGTIIGTPGYMSPEQQHGDPVEPSTDIYGLGCVLFEILTLKRLRTDTLGALHPIEHDPDVSPELDRLCARATATSPRDRPATARELADLTQRFLDGDRDLELRKRLADEHYRRAARAAVERELVDEQHQLAIREGGRALALDPTHRDAAHLVTWLMVEPPRRLPEALDRELRASTDAEVRRQARLGIGAYGMLGVFIPHMVWSGIREPLYLAAFTILLGLLIGHAILGTQPIRYPRIAPILSMSLNTALVVLLGRMYSPFIVAPGVAALIGVVVMGSSLFRSRRMAATAITVLSLAVIGPYLLELLGVLAPTMTLTGHALVIDHAALDLRALPTAIGLIGFAIGLIGIATTLSWVIASRGADARQHLQVQAWQLRQLIPASVGTSVEA